MGLDPASAWFHRPISSRWLSSPIICDLDTWVLRHATQQLASWNQQTGSRDLVMAVNISGRHVARPRIVADVRSAVADAGIEARQLILEITETALIDDPIAFTNLAELRRIGIGIAIEIFWLVGRPTPKMYVRAISMRFSRGTSTPAIRAMDQPCRCLCLGLEQMTMTVP